MQMLGIIKTLDPSLNFLQPKTKQKKKGGRDSQNSLDVFLATYRNDDPQPSQSDGISRNPERCGSTPLN